MSSHVSPKFEHDQWLWSTSTYITFHYFYIIYICYCLLLSFSSFHIDNDDFRSLLSSSEPTFGLFQVGSRNSWVLDGSCYLISSKLTTHPKIWYFMGFLGSIYHLLPKRRYKSPQLRLRSLCAPGCGLEPQPTGILESNCDENETDICDLTETHLMIYESWHIKSGPKCTWTHVEITIIQSPIAHMQTRNMVVNKLIDLHKMGKDTTASNNTMFGIHDCVNQPRSNRCKQIFIHVCVRIFPAQNVGRPQCCKVSDQRRYPIWSWHQQTASHVPTLQFPKSQHGH